MNVGSFSLGFKNWERLFDDRHKDLKRAVALKLFGAVIKDTPVDTGRLRSNWQTSLQSPDYGTSSTNTSEAMEKLTLVAGSLVTGAESILMCNSLPYTRRIEYDGWSHTKAPQGMVNKNVIRFRAILSGQLSALKKGGSQ